MRPAISVQHESRALRKDAARLTLTKTNQERSTL
jgi:hypothetical protein